jgi:hypothetical protein
MTTINICGARMKEVHRERLGVRWCFVCRKRTEFVFIVKDTVEMSYWGPTASVECERRGHYDGDLFPGRYREWDGE